MVVSGSKSLISWDRPLRYKGCAPIACYAQPIASIILDSIHVAKHSFSVLQIYYHGFICQDHRKSFPPTFLVVILAMMANKKLKIFS